MGRFGLTDVAVTNFLNYDEEYVAPGEQQFAKPAKEEYAIAKWMRKNVPIKKTKFLNHNVQYFTACKAVDALMESHWCKGTEPFFKTRESIVDYLHDMLEHKFFHRARKVPVSDQELKAKKKDKKSPEAIDDKKDKIKDSDKEKKEKVTDAESSVTEAKKEEGAVDKEKRKRKIRLDMHNDQRFVDGLDAYVWIYDPIPFHYWIIGTLLVLGAIGVCLFPLWPPTVRMGVYYLSVAAAGFLVFIILLAILRLIIFCLIWVATFGKHHLWILPNLTEDVGFFASFWPLYTYEYKGASSNSKKHKKDKDSDAEEEPDKKVEEDLKEPSIKSATASENDKQTDNGAENTQTEEVQGGSESESESSQRSSTGKDFEMVDQVDLDS
ncbi:hypothetical protein FQR65_LT11187 [Abscondita terminalis]|nr:hypothetical protein FQR65_LT11187 [Abscondita terminalis]